MSGIDASVLVPTLDERRWLPETAPHILGQEFDGELEFLFIDGGSTDGTDELLRQLAAGDSRVQVIDNPAGRIPNALNAGLRAARGEFVVRMDAHTFFPDRYVQLAVDRLRSGDVDWVAGPVVPVGSGAWSRRIAKALATRSGQGGSRKWAVADGEGQAEHVDLDTGVFAGAWRRSLLERYGGWDESWAVNEDAELAARMLADGRRIVSVPELAARYLTRDRPGALARQYWRFGFYRVKTALRHPHALRRTHLVAPGLVLVTLGAFADRRISPAARLMLAAYALRLLAEGIEQTEPGDRREALGIAAALATMHYAWGAGFLAGCVRFGPPTRALLRAAYSEG